MAMKLRHGRQALRELLQGAVISRHHGMADFQALHIMLDDLRQHFLDRIPHANQQVAATSQQHAT